MSGVISAGSVSWKAFFVAIVVQLASAAFSLVTGGWSAAVEQSNEKYARSPIAVLCRTLASTSVLVACAYAGVTSSIALIASACATFPIDLARFLWTRTLVPRGHEATGIGDVLRGARGSLLLMVAAATQGGLWPAVAAAVAPLAVGVAIPARTVANGARLLSAVAQNVLWAPLAGRFASIGDPTRMYEFWKRHAPILGVVQMTGVVGLVVVAPAAVHLWLPSKAAGIDGLLPIFCAEQALLIATIPSIVLLPAVGHFGRLGAMQAAQSLVGVVITLLLMPRFGALGFAVASVSSTALCMVPGALLAEYAHWSSMGRTPTGLLGARLALAMAALACAPTMALSRWLAGGLAISVFAAGSVHALWALRLGRADKTPSATSWRSTSDCGVTIPEALSQSTRRSARADASGPRGNLVVTILGAGAGGFGGQDQCVVDVFRATTSADIRQPRSTM
jgi:hypothetical protein